jgi:hypothetical protein
VLVVLGNTDSGTQTIVTHVRDLIAASQRQ